MEGQGELVEGALKVHMFGAVERIGVDYRATDWM